MKITIEYPLVSIILPVFNDSKYIERCIQSVLSQEYPHIELMIIDGGSIDGTVDVLTRYKYNYPDKIRFISEPDKGAGDAWNKGLKLAKGDIFGLLGADDAFKAGAINAVVDFFRSIPGAFFVHGGCDIIDPVGNVIYKHEVDEFDYHEFANTARHISSPSAFYKREVIETIGWLDSSGDDFDVMLRITREFEVYGIDKILSELMIRTDSAFNSPRNFRALSENRKETFKISRQYGGDLLSPIALRYYAITIVGLLHLGLLYPFLKKVYKKCHIFHLC